MSADSQVLNQSHPAIEELLRDLVEVLCRVTGTAAGIRNIASALPTTTITDEAETLCPELLFAVLGASVTEHANHGLTLVEMIQKTLKGATK